MPFTSSSILLSLALIAADEPTTAPTTNESGGYKLFCDAAVSYVTHIKSNRVIDAPEKTYSLPRKGHSPTITDRVQFWNGYEVWYQASVVKKGGQFLKDKDLLYVKALFVKRLSETEVKVLNTQTVISDQIGSPEELEIAKSHLQNEIVASMDNPELVTIAINRSEPTTFDDLLTRGVVADGTATRAYLHCTMYNR